MGRNRTNELEHAWRTLQREVRAQATRVRSPRELAAIDAALHGNGTARAWLVRAAQRAAVDGISDAHNVECDAFKRARATAERIDLEESES